MKKQTGIGLFTLLCIIASGGIASATDYVTTWKNQFASNTSCSLSMSVVNPVATIPDTTSYTFTSLGQTKNVTISSPSCNRITLSASCSFTDAQGNKKGVNFGSQSASCGNNTATLNPSIPGSMTVTPTQEKPHNVL